MTRSPRERLLPSRPKRQAATEVIPIQRGSDQAAPPSVRELMALNPVLHEDPRARGQAIFLKAEPRATRLGKTPPAGSHMLAERLRLVKIINVVRNHQSVKIIACC